MTTTNPTLTFTGTGVFIDDLTIEYTDVITVDEASDNGLLLAGNLNQYVDVTLNRTLTAGIWNTLCLPFDLNRTLLNNLASGIEVRVLSAATTGSMTFVDMGTSGIVAGRPFLIKVPSTLVNPVFRGVTISADAGGTETKGTCSFTGILNPYDLATDGTQVFLGTDGYLYRPGAAPKNHMNGLRAYFTIPSGSRFVIDFEDDVDGIVGVTEQGGQPVREQSYRLNKYIYIKDGKKYINK